MLHVLIAVIWSCGFGSSSASLCGLLSDKNSDFHFEIHDGTFTVDDSDSDSQEPPSNGPDGMANYLFVNTLEAEQSGSAR